jgi:hypothetical protein
MTHDLRVVPFKRWHLAWLESTGVAPGGKGHALDDLTLEYLERCGSWTGVCDGEPIACAGFIEQWPGRTIAWAYLNRDSAQHMLFITRRVREALSKIKGRIELTVRCDFDIGHRWARMLGFNVETYVMKAYGPEGEDHTSYVRHN